MRRAPITAGLLILALAASAFGCTTGWSSRPQSSCAGVGARRACVKKKPGITVAKGSACGDSLRSSSEQCNLRSFAQSQRAEIHRFEMPRPLRDASGEVLQFFDSVFIASSIDWPDTDRGPPRS